ncbi:MAG: leucyl aminopeptidase family protein, partial [Luteimonas sp.]
MTLPHGFTSAASATKPLYCVQRAGLGGWRQSQLPNVGSWIDAHTFDAASGSLLLLPGDDGIAGAVLGIGDLLDPFAYAHAPFALPPGDWTLAGELDAEARKALLLGWGLGSYKFARYKQPARLPARLVVDDADADDETFAILAACLRVRDLVNTPTQDMGPQQLEDVARDIAKTHGAQIDVITGDALLQQNFPAIHAVGRASHRAPRLIELHWPGPGGSDAAHPHVAIVGKGVCFDTGGLDIKPADGMRNMKKDMGGAAHAIALAELIMARNLPLRLTLLVPAVENAIGPDAFRPGEVIATKINVK